MLEGGGEGEREEEGVVYSMAFKVALLRVTLL